MCMSEQMLAQYRRYLQQLADNDSGELFTNGGKEHAVMLYSVLFSKVNSHVRIFCEGAHSEIWNHPIFADAFVKMVEKGVATVDILLEETPDRTGIPFPDYLNRLLDRSSGIRIREISENDHGYIRDVYGSNNVNFSVFDNRMFRFEYDKTAYKAYGSFNDKDTAAGLAAFFDRIFSNADPVSNGGIFRNPMEKITSADFKFDSESGSGFADVKLSPSNYSSISGL